MHALKLLPAAGVHEPVKGTSGTMGHLSTHIRLVEFLSGISRMKFRHVTQCSGPWGSKIKIALIKRHNDEQDSVVTLTI